MTQQGIFRLKSSNKASNTQDGSKVSNTSFKVIIITITNPAVKDHQINSMCIGTSGMLDV